MQCHGTGGKVMCPHPQDCSVDCQFNNAVVTRTIKPYPAVPPDPVDTEEDWLSLDELMIGAIWVAVALIVGVMVGSVISYVAILI